MSGQEPERSEDLVPEGSGGSGRGRERRDGLGALLAEALAFARGHLEEGRHICDYENSSGNTSARSWKSPHCVPGESDRRRLPGDAKAGAVGGSEAGGAVTAAGRDGHWSCGLRAEGQRSM